jgi:hypothetical protein
MQEGYMAGDFSSPNSFSIKQTSKELMSTAQWFHLSIHPLMQVFKLSANPVYWAAISTSPNCRSH